VRVSDPARMSSFAETSSEGDGLPSKRALGAFPSFASQGEDQISSTSFQDTLGLYGMAVLKFGLFSLFLPPDHPDDLIHDILGRFGNPKRRLLMWSKDDPTNLFWCQDFTELSSVMRVREIPPDARSVNLLDVHEIRRGTEEDPTHPGYCGTTILRKHCHPSKFCYAISLITDTRSHLCFASFPLSFPLPLC
jgi:hypothetical protein